MKPAHSFNEFYGQVLIRKTAFLVAFFVVIFVSYAFLYIIDFIPEPVQADQEGKQQVEQQAGTDNESVAMRAQQELNGDNIMNVVIPDQLETLPENAEIREPVRVLDSPVPLKITFDSLDREVTVMNPASRTIADLDEALLSGAVRHPDSADFQEDGNIFILGHSSYLPNVFNKNFQAFNGIQELVWGDIIRLESGDTEYTYRVDKVYKAKASEIFVPETPGEARLTLATCNSFGSKDDRFMIEAVLVSQAPLTS